MKFSYMETIDNDGSYDEKDYRQYFITMDAICTRNPKRVNQNCIEMLWAKVLQIKNGTLRADAKKAMTKLVATTRRQEV